MAEEKTDRRTEIMAAARSEFLSRGYEGARLQNIAGHIGVTKAMIHYYFNTKKELFEHVYRLSVVQVFGGLSEVLQEETPLFKKIEKLVSLCLEKSAAEAEVLGFVLTESSRNANWLLPIFEEEVSLDQKKLGQQLEQAASNYIITSVDPNQLLLNIFSLCHYPSLSIPLHRSLLNDDTLIDNREGIVLDTILNWLTA